MASQYHEDYMKPAQFHIDYDEYTKLCVTLGLKPQLPVKEGKHFYEHFHQLLHSISQSDIASSPDLAKTIKPKRKKNDKVQQLPSEIVPEQ